MKVLQPKDVVKAPETSMICMSISEHTDYKTKKADGTYDIDIYMPKLERAATVNCKAVEESVKPMRQITFDGLTVKLSAPKQWDISVKLKADTAKGV